MKITMTIISLSAILSGLTLWAQDLPKPAAGGKTTELKAFPSVLVKDATHVEAPPLKFEGGAQLDKVSNAIVVVDCKLVEISPAPLLDKAAFVHDLDRSLGDSRHIIGMPQLP